MPYQTPEQQSAETASHIRPAIKGGQGREDWELSQGFISETRWPGLVRMIGFALVLSAIFLAIHVVHKHQVRKQELALENRKP